jgi:hypothetical protein
MASTAAGSMSEGSSGGGLSAGHGLDAIVQTLQLTGGASVD